jgi:hypothetical protein
VLYPSSNILSLSLSLSYDRVGVTVGQQASSELVPFVNAKRIVIARPPVRCLGGTTIELDDGTSVEADVVLMCTGFARRFSFLDSVLPPESQVCLLFLSLSLSVCSYPVSGLRLIGKPAAV